LPPHDGIDVVTAAPSRPRDVAFAGVLTIMGSVLALVGIFSAQGELRSSGVRREIESLLSDDRFAAVDLPVDAVLNLVEYGLMAASAASVAAIVLAVFVMRRHNPSRIALTVLGGVAALLLLVSWPAGLVISIFVAYTVSLLWRAPVRGWFAVGDGSDDRLGPDRNPDAVPDPDPRWPQDPAQPSGDPAQPPGDPAQPPADPARPPADPAQPPADPARPPVGPDQPGNGPGPYPRPWPPEPDRPAGSGEPTSSGPGEPARPDPYGSQPGAYQQPPREQGYGYPPPYPSASGQGYPPGAGYGYPAGYYGYPPAAVDPDRRPGQLIGAHVMTWIGCAFGLLTGVFFVAAAGSPDVIDLVREQFPGSGITQGQLLTAGVVSGLWSLAVLVVSVFSWRRANWAAILLTVMGVGYLVVQLFTLIAGQPAVLFTIVWVAVVVVLLWWPTSRQWYAARRSPRSYGPPSGGSPYQQPPAQPPKRNQPW
jgi:hypothetical protein